MTVSDGWYVQRFWWNTGEIEMFLDKESDVSPFEEWIKSGFDRVLSGKSEYEEVNGNVCCAEISPKTTKVYDNLAEDAMENWCEVDTREFQVPIKRYDGEGLRHEMEDAEILNHYSYDAFGNQKIKLNRLKNLSR